uniref:AP2/ERF domain-containing protein n=1 Tax=viral metagenome TaxID=1070528 RepID=A0A6C0BK27_9ZZZZ
MSVEIPLHDRTGMVVKYALISPEDKELIEKYKWHQVHGKYAAAWINGRQTRMHHVILGKPGEKMVIDHKNQNGFDNRRENLRMATFSQNSQNVTRHPNNEYFGIGFTKREQKWFSRCQNHHLGSYDNPRDAALAYDKCAYLIFGKDAKTNHLVAYEECKDLKLDDLVRTNRHQLPKYIYFNKSKGLFHAHREINHQIFQSPCYKTQQEAEKWLTERQSQFDEIIKNLTMSQQNQPITRNDHGQAIINGRGITAIVDDDLWTKLNEYSWGSNNGYVHGLVNGKRIAMHRHIMQLRGHDLTLLDSRKYYVDHINGLKYDNRYGNLRINTTSGNAHNRKKDPNASSKYHGVHYYQSRSKWSALIQKDHVQYNLGDFITENEAAQAYNIKAKELYGEFAKLNVIEGEIVNHERTRKKIKDNLCPYHGVRYDKRRSKWIAEISKDCHRYYLGQYETDKEAAMAYNKKAVELYGDLANLNNLAP